MGFLIFLGIIAVVALVGWAIVYGFRRAEPEIGITHVYTASNEMELATTLGALDSADIGYHIIDRTPVPRWRFGGQFFQEQEIWVRDEDVEGAQAVLGLDVETEVVGDDYSRGDVRG